jgi:hypothetical protein
VPYKIVDLKLHITAPNESTLDQLAVLRKLLNDDLSFEDMLESYFQHAVNNAISVAEGDDLACLHDKNNLMAIHLKVTIEEKS